MDTSFGVASFSVNQASQQNKYVPQRTFFCQQALNIGTESIMNNLLQNQIGEKYNCEKCRFSTKDPNKYRNHVSLHNDIKYTCSHCEFVSYTKTEFQRHLVTHTGKFPFTCGYCGYGAIRNDYIIKHIRRIHGDGKIQCSVSTIENESKKASINITQTQMATPNVQNVLQNRPPSTEDVIDLTSEMDNLGSSSNAFSPNRNNNADNIEVEVMSPVNEQLYPWSPLTVTAPTSFKVPLNCVAEVVEVKSVNSACHLVLKCLNVIKPSVPNQPIHSDHTYEQKPLKPHIPSKNIIENTSAPLLQECAVLHDESQKKKLFTSKMVCEVQENPQSCEPCLIDKTSEVMNAIEDFANEMCDDLEEFSGGPIISSVFSLSSDSQNAIEGINWDCPNTSLSNVDVNATHLYSKPPSSQEPLAVCSSKSNFQMDIDKCDSQNAIEGINWDFQIKSPLKDINSTLSFLKPISSAPPAVYGSQSNSQMDIDKSDSQNPIEGINWDCPNTSSSNDVNSTHYFSKPSSNPELSVVCSSQSNSQMDIDKFDSQNANEGINGGDPNTSSSNDVNSTHYSLKPSSSPQLSAVCSSQSNCQMDIDKSDSQNAIEGINLDCPNTSSSNDDVNSTHYSSKPSSSPEPSAVFYSQSNSQMDIDKSDSQNTVEEINRDCPNKSPSNVSSTHSSSKPPSSEPPAVCGSQSNCQMGIDKSQDLLENIASKSEKESSEIPMENVPKNVDAEIQFSVKSVSTDVKEPESQPCVLQERMGGERRSSRLSKKEINNFITPQALFLSCDKRIVMQPLSCTMQNDKMTSRMDEVTKKLQVLVRMRNESAKVKTKRLVAPVIKSSFLPNLRTLRLHPVRMDQANHIPSYNQPVVVLNHPDLETIEISYIMKGIRMFRGKVTKITLSKQKCV